MRKLFKLKIIVSMLLILLVLIAPNSCKKDEDKDDLPELPPVEAFLMDFSDFEGDIPGSKKAVESYVNWGYSALNVGIWSLISTVIVAVPVVAYAEAFNQQPVYLGDNSWQWSYDVTVNQEIYTAKLISKRISNEEFTLKMLVSKSGLTGFEDFKWFEGTVRYDRTSATWTLYQSPDVADPVISITWTMDWEEELYTIRYTNVQPVSDEYGSYIEHGVTENTTFDAYYTISMISGTVEIEWNRTTRAGHVKSPEYFADNDWHCWDNNLIDIICQ